MYSPALRGMVGGFSADAAVFGAVTRRIESDRGLSNSDRFPTVRSTPQNATLGLPLGLAPVAQHRLIHFATLRPGAVCDEVFRVWCASRDDVVELGLVEEI